MKRVVKLRESELHKMITKSVKRALNEGHYNSEVYNEFEEIRSTLGDDTIISEMYDWMDSDEIEEFIEAIKREYDLDY